MSKKTIKLLSIILTIAVVLMTFAVPVFANNTVDVDTFTPGDLTATSIGASGTKIKNAGQKIIGAIQAVGMVVSVVVIAVLGIKYMVGSAEEKASYKKTMIPYLVGAVLIFGASSIANLIYGAATNLA